MKRHPIYLVATIAAILMLPLNASAYRFAECHFKDPSAKTKFYCCKARHNKYRWVERFGHTSHENQKIACGLNFIPTSSKCGKNSHVHMSSPVRTLTQFCIYNRGESTFVKVKYYEKSSWSAK